MAEWVKASSRKKGTMLLKLSKEKYWPPGKKAKGPKATDFPERFKKCVGLLKHAPAIQHTDGTYEIVPMRPLPPNSPPWKNVIGFDPHAHFQSNNISIEKAYKLECWSRTGKAFAPLPLPRDPSDLSKELPHGAAIHFHKVPLCFVPASLLLLWLYYHGVPHPKGAKKDELISQVRLALDAKQALDYDRIALSLSEGTAAQSYISWEKIMVEAELNWIDSPPGVIDFFRSAAVPKVDDDASKCDCPNGWLFCSHMLSFFLFIYLVQLKEKWSYDDIQHFMPEPIKSLQSLPFAACTVFNELASFPGWDAYLQRRFQDTRLIRGQINDEDDQVPVVMSMDLCKKLVEYVIDSEIATSIDKGQSKYKKRITSSEINKGNEALVRGDGDKKRELKKALRHDRLHGMMKDKVLSDDNAISYHFEHFAEERKRDITRLRVEVGGSDMPLKEAYDKDFFSNYFAQDGDDW